MRKSKIEKEVSKYAKEKYNWSYVKQASRLEKGQPDRYFYNTNGRIIFVEFKNARGKLSRLQERYIKDLRDKGFKVAVISSIKTGMELFDSIERLNKIENVK